ncbi:MULTISPECIES: TAXI family TRAP transporter solute-binding subunit [unclassified Meridianimarinicoccus]|uniref:TAXI family TRAP transporter solute-binding subunit n=1 Tax=unclassified Meridianimarinicoccus TaxID=2923344 RepID=UPI0018665DA9|nr:TAXI family TRAP transporter solute-binding subunit [Fluviibacterium sp. MJW13]
MRRYLRSTLVALLVFCHHVAVAEPVKLFSIGSGDISGNYYPVAQAICKAFNRADDSRRRCSPEPSPGSIYNLTALQEGALEFAIVQSDWLNAAFLGTAPFSHGPAMTDLRVIAALYSETITVLVAPGSDIFSALDMLGKKVDIGRPASGRNATVNHLLESLDFSLGDFGSVRELLPANAIEELCKGTIDAAILVVGHPSALVAEAVERCGVRFIEFDGPRIRELLGRSDTYRKSFIDLGMYGLPGEEIPSLSVVASLVTRTTVDEKLVADLYAAIQQAAPMLAEEIPVLSELQSFLVSSTPLGVPAHDVVERAP